MIEPGEWAVTVNELEEGEFHFTLLRAVNENGADDFLCYRPETTGETAHPHPMNAWMAGIRALRGRGVLENTASVEGAAADSDARTFVAKREIVLK